jgi:methyl-accepting chemotaxis protein
MDALADHVQLSIDKLPQARAAFDNMLAQIKEQELRFLEQLTKTFQTLSPEIIGEKVAAGLSKGTEAMAIQLDATRKTLQVMTEAAEKMSKSALKVDERLDEIEDAIRRTAAAAERRSAVSGTTIIKAIMRHLLRRGKALKSG